LHKAKLNIEKTEKELKKVANLEEAVVEDEDEEEEEVPALL
jgi:hypothetical protein